MKKYILLIFACIYAIHLNAQNAGINFLHGTTWAEAVAKAKAENKLIFIDFYTQWCGPCLNMAQTVFSLPTVGYYYNQTFINLKIDAEEGEGITLAKKYGVRSYPTYAFIDPATEEIVHRSSEPSDSRTVYSDRKRCKHSYQTLFLPARAIYQGEQRTCILD